MSRDGMAIADFAPMPPPRRRFALVGAPLLIAGCATSSGGCFDIDLSNLCFYDAGVGGGSCEGTVWVTTETGLCSGQTQTVGRTDCAKTGLQCVAAYGCAVACTSDGGCPAGSYCSGPICNPYLEAGSLCMVGAGPLCPPGQQCEQGPPGEPEAGFEDGGLDGAGDEADTDADAADAAWWSSLDWDAAWTQDLGFCR
jgi:hypothetical protein